MPGIDVLTTDEAAVLLGTSARRVRSLVAEGALRAADTGPLRVWRSDVEALARRRAAEPPRPGLKAGDPRAVEAGRRGAAVRLRARPARGG